MPKTILAVDDDAEELGLLRSFLEDKGYNVVTCQDGKQSMREIIVKKPDLIILDINMPNMDGLNVLDTIKLIQLSKDVPVMVWSGETDRETIDKAEKLGADDFVVKPTPVEDLGKRIAALLFSVDFTKVQEILGQVTPPGPGAVEGSGLDAASYPEWDLYPVTVEGMSLCVFLSKELSPKDALELPEDKAASQVVVFVKLRNRWKRLWTQG